MKHDASDELYVVVALSQGTLGRLTHHGEGLREQVVWGLSIGQSRSELISQSFQSIVWQMFEARLYLVDLIDEWSELLDRLLGGPSDQFGDTL